ncbi:MAG: hypothetical protein ABH823_04015 [bacterium]
MGHPVGLGGFNRLRPQTLPLKAGMGTGNSVPAKTSDLLKAIVGFARCMALPSLPAITMARLRHHPQFRYVFSQLVFQPDLVYGEGSVTLRARYALLLEDPDLVTDKDFHDGLAKYLNNFIGFMPLGFKRAGFREYGIYKNKEHIFQFIDQILEQKGWREQEASLWSRFDLERNICNGHSQRRQYLNLCLEVFNILVAEHDINPVDLWA